MKIKYLLITLLLQVCLYATIFAQQSNLNEDYSAYMPEVRNLNKMLAQSPKNGTVLTKEGLAKEREGMKVYLNTNTVIKPSVKNIQGPGGNIPLYIFKPDTIRAVVLEIHGGGWIEG